jgi:hypothetical protein
MRRHARVLTHIAAALACLPGLAWAQVDALKHDPFARPTFLKATPPPGLQLRDSSGLTIAALPERPWKPELAAVMVAGAKSAVSIDGTMVRIGEVINGHRLVEVQEHAATFIRNGKRVTLTLRGMEPAPAASRKEERVPQAGAATAPQQDTRARPDDPGTASRDERKTK